MKSNLYSINLKKKKYKYNYRYIATINYVGSYIIFNVYYPFVYFSEFNKK